MGSSRVALRAVAGPMALALVCASCRGGAGETDTGSSNDAPADQTIEVGMVDIAYEPTAITVKSGTTVRFVFRNEGALPHEAFFGDEPAQQEYAKGRGKRVGVVGPGQTRSYVHTFPQPGRLLIGCHVPGHYQAGMKARLTVE